MEDSWSLVVEKRRDVGRLEWNFRTTKGVLVREVLRPLERRKVAFPACWNAVVVATNITNSSKTELTRVSIPSVYQERSQTMILPVYTFKGRSTTTEVNEVQRSKVMFVVQVVPAGTGRARSGGKKKLNGATKKKPSTRRDTDAF